MEQAPLAQNGEQLRASAMRTSISRGEIDVILWRDGFELTGLDDRQIAMIPGQFATAADLARLLGIPESDIADAR